MFKHVYGPNSSQENVFESLGMPLVLDLLQGKNGLLFSYGITNGGKTFTVSGDHDNPGILPRALDVIFNSIDGTQAKKYVKCFFTPLFNRYIICYNRYLNLIEQMGLMYKVKLMHMLKKNSTDQGN